MSGGVRNVREYVDAMTSGQQLVSHFRKVPSQTTTAGWWVDLSMAAGNPPPNYYASDPLTAATLSGFRGLFHGDDKSPARKFLGCATMCTPTAGLVGMYKLLDYILYYPFVDLDSTDEQPMDNTVTLPRYEDGDGVMAMLVAVAPTTGSGTFTYTYVDQNGATQTSPTITCSTAAATISSIVTSQPAVANSGNLFLPMASGSSGIRSITSFTGIVPNGGLGAIVLVKPLADLDIREINVPKDAEYLSMRPAPPRIYDDAYLGLVVNCAATVAAGTLAGQITTVWN